MILHGIELAGAFVGGWVTAVTMVLLTARRKIRQMRGGFLVGK